jgi:hypothetical protein
MDSPDNQASGMPIGRSADSGFAGGKSKAGDPSAAQGSGRMLQDCRQNFARCLKY